MPTLTEGFHAGEWLISDNGPRSRDTITVTAALNTKIPTGTVLGKITATGKYVAHNNGAADGSQTAAAVLIYDIDSGAARDVKAAAYTRDAEVWGPMLNGGAGIASTPDVVAELDARGIVVRA